MSTRQGQSRTLLRFTTFNAESQPGPSVASCIVVTKHAHRKMRNPARSCDVVAFGARLAGLDAGPVSGRARRLTGFVARDAAEVRQQPPVDRP